MRRQASAHFDQWCFSLLQPTLNNDQCWEWPLCHNSKGYGRIASILLNGKREQLAHRVSWIVTYDAIPNHLFVLHHCDNPPCCRPSHLFLGTQAQNMQDRNSKGRMPSYISSQWSRKHIACIQCQQTDSPHSAHGLCHRCHQKREYYAHASHILLQNGQWSVHYPACLKCGTQQRKHAGHGLCSTCHMQWQRQQRKDRSHLL